MKRLLGLVIVGLLAAGIVSATARRGQLVEPSRGTTTSTSSGGPAVETVVVPPPGQVIVTGPLDALDATGATGPALGLPMTLTVDTRGAGGARIQGVEVDGRPSTIVWDGGRPFAFSGTGGIVLGAAQLSVRKLTVSWLIDGDARPLLPGTYISPTSVAVGREGLAEPHDGVTFTATRGATIESHGGVRAARDARTQLHIDGPGTVTLAGQFTVRTHDGTSAARRIVSTDGPYAIDIGPEGVRAILQGRIS